MNPQNPHHNHLELQTTSLSSGCFNWMMNQIITLKNGWKSPFPSIKKWLEITKHPLRNGWLIGRDPYNGLI